MRQLEQMAMVLALVGAGCTSDDGGPGLTGEPPSPDLTTTDDPTTTSTTSTTSGSSEDTGMLECGLDQSCPAGRFCAAPHQAGLLEPAGDFVCRSECIPAGSTSFWCLDDEGCCGAATCDARFGLCKGTGESTTDTGTSTGDTDESTSDASTTDASTSDASTSDASTTDGGDTSTGANSTDSSTGR